MTDDRNSGSIPPASGPAAPPPLAAPPPVAPPQPPAAAPHPPAPRRKTGLWLFFLFLAFAAGVGGTILTLWLTGELWNSSASHAPSSYGGSTATTTTTGTTPPAPSANPPPPMTSGGYALSEASLRGTWGPGCPGSRNETITFYADGTAESDGDTGSWSLNGNYVTLNNGRQTMTLYWEMTGSDTARVRRSGDSETQTISRCP